MRKEVCPSCGNSFIKVDKRHLNSCGPVECSCPAGVRYVGPNGECMTCRRVYLSPERVRYLGSGKEVTL